MITIGIVAVAGIAYFFEYYAVALIVILYGIVNGGLALIKSVRNPAWYEYRARMAGVEPNIGQLYFFKAVALIILSAAALYVSSKAGYLD